MEQERPAEPVRVQQGEIALVVQLALAGRQVSRVAGNGAATYALDCAAWPRGTYLVRVRSGRQTVMQAISLTK